MANVEQQQVQVKAQWVLDQGAPPVANQMLLQGGTPLGDGQPTDGVYVTFGHLSPPAVALPMSDAEKAAFESSVFPIIPVGRFFVSIERLRSFHGVIGSFLEREDASAK